MNTKQLRTTTGFTLIDLVTVLAVLTIIAFALSPICQSIRARSALISCKNNLRQTGKAITMYANDYGNSLPGPLWYAAYHIYGKNQAGGLLATYLWPYAGGAPISTNIQELQILKCPAVTQLEKAPPSPPSAYLNRTISYQVPMYFTNRFITTGLIHNPFGYPYSLSGLGPDALPVKTTAIGQPSEQIAVYDMDTSNTTVNLSSSYGPYLPPPVHNNRPGRSRNVVTRNYLYMDGNVQTLGTSF